MLTPRPLPLALAALLAGGALAAGLLTGCGSARAPYTLGPVKTYDPDTRAIPEPDDVPENTYWDPADYTVLTPLTRLFDLGWLGRKAGEGLGFVGPEPAVNVNALDEVPNSSWFTQRHFYHPMTAEELVRGPDVNAGPDTARAWTVVAGKATGRTKGFTIEDARGDRYIIKIPNPRFPEAYDSAEAIASKVFYAAGYFVPQNTVVYFDPARLVLDPEAEVEEGGRERRMTDADLRAILDQQPRRASDGFVRATASKYVDGIPMGVWDFEGTRPDDPNDRVRHEDRREDRGLAVLGAWLNDTDRRNANTMAVYTTRLAPTAARPAGDTLRYIQHYLLDMGSTLGANGPGVHTPLHGNGYYTDLGRALGHAITFGAVVDPWEDEAWGAVQYPETGYYEADIFDPERWRMTYPNPAYAKLTPRDAFWGAKRVIAFTDADLAAIVRAAGRLTNPEAEAYLIRTMARRRDIVARYWFGKVNPLDRFAVTADGAAAGTLAWDDLAVTYGLEPATARYAAVVRHRGREVARDTLAAPALALALPDPNAPAGHDRVLEVELRTLRAGAEPSRRTTVYVHFPPGQAPRLAGLVREE